MSLRHVLFTAAIGFVLGGLSVEFYRSLPSRRPASVFPAPRLKLKPWAESLSGKMHQAMEVHITTIGGVPDHDSQDLRLRAEVILNRPMDQEVKFQWVLPPDASLVSGELEDAWFNLEAGQTATTEITVNGVSKESVMKTVSLHVSGSANGVQYASSGSFATNSAEQMAEAQQAVGVMSLQSSQLALKKSESAAKIKKVHE